MREPPELSNQAAQSDPPSKKNMEKILAEQIRETFQAAVVSQINGDREHGWVAADSMAVIEDVVAEDAKAAKGAYKGLSPEAKQYIEYVINPSAARQSFERSGWLNVPKKDQPGRRGGLASVMANLKPMVAAGSSAKAK